MTNGDRERILGKVRDRAVEEIKQLLDELWPEIITDLDRACIEASKQDKSPKFQVGVTIKLAPGGNRCGLSVKVGWGNRKTTESDREEISLTPDLPFEKEDN